MYKCFSLFMFWIHVVSDYANIKLKDQQYVYSVPVSFYFKNTFNSQGAKKTNLQTRPPKVHLIQ